MRNNPKHQDMLEITTGKSLCKKGPGGLQVKCELALCTFHRAGKLRLNPSTKHWRNYTWRIVSSVRLPSNEKIWAYWKESSEGPQRCLRDGVTSPMGKAERAGTVQPREEEAQG